MSISKAAASDPTLDEVVDQNLKWYLGRYGRREYKKLIKKYVEVGEEWGLIRIDNDAIHPEWELTSEILKKGGDYLSWIYSDRIYDQKLRQMRSIKLLDIIHRERPTIDEINPQDIGCVGSSQVIYPISVLQTLGVVHVPESGPIFTDLAYQILGERAEYKIKDSLESPTSRAIFDVICKMPAIKLSDLHKFIPVEYEETEYIEIISSLKKNKFIVLFKDYDNGELLLIPTWIFYPLFELKPTVLDTKQLKELIRACSKLWDYIEDLSEIDSSILSLVEYINILIKKGHMTMEELIEIGNPYLIFFHSIRKLGLLNAQDDNFYLIEKNMIILDALLQILKEIPRVSFWEDHPRKENIDDIQKDISASKEEVLSYLAEKIKTSDYQKIKDLF